MITAIDRRHAKRPGDEPEQSKTLTVRAAAKQLGIAESFLYRLIQRGDAPFPVLRLGRRVVVSRVALERYLAGDGDHAA